MDAPDSLVMTMGMEDGRPASLTAPSASRDAVPLPMAMASIWNCSTSLRTWVMASFAWPTPMVRWRTVS